MTAPSRFWAGYPGKGRRVPVDERVTGTRRPALCTGSSSRAEWHICWLSWPGEVAVRVLIVEDEPGLRSYLGPLLERDGYTVEAVGHSRRGVGYLLTLGARG